MSVVINGGGIIGLFLAGMLSRLTHDNLEIYIIEAYPPNFYNLSSCHRMPNIIALSREAYFEFMKVHENSILSACSTIINTIEITEYSKFNTVIIQSQDYQLSEFGYVINLKLLRKELFYILSKRSTIHICSPAKIQTIQRKKSCNIITLNNGKKIISKLMIAADGSASQLATYCGMQWIRWNYKQFAIITEITTEIPNYGTAFEKFTQFGSLALLPISNNLSCVIWCISNQLQKEVLKWDQNKFIQELQKIFGWKLGKILNIKKRFFYDLWLIYAKKHIMHRIALVGNAAQTIHPVAGQGFNLGMRDAIVLANIISQSFYNNLDIGEYSILEMYQKKRRSDQYKTIMITDTLVHIFSNCDLPLVISRSLGLFFISHSFFLKNFLINKIFSWDID